MAVKVEAMGGRLVRISVKVVPGSSRDRIAGELGEELKIAVSKPPEGSAANRAVITLLADVFKIPARNLTIVSGQTNPHKRIQIDGLTAAQVLERLGL